MPPVKASQDPHPNALGLDLHDYLELVDWAGRAIREGKRGHIPEHTPALLQRLGMAPSGYLRQVQGHSQRPRPIALGAVEHPTRPGHPPGSSVHQGDRSRELSLLDGPCRSLNVAGRPPCNDGSRRTSLLQRPARWCLALAIGTHNSAFFSSSALTRTPP